MTIQGAILDALLTPAGGKVKLQVTGHPRTESDLGVQVNVFAAGAQLTFFMPPGQAEQLIAQLRIAIEKATGAR